MKGVVFIDGQNLKGRINEVFEKHNKDTPKWSEYDFKGLFDEVFPESYLSYQRLFYRAKPKRHPDLKNLSEILLKEFRDLGGHLNRLGIKAITAGRLRADYKKSCDKKPTFREKGVDIRLAVDMITMACDKEIDEALLVASDSDYQPAIAELKKKGIKTIYVGFEVNPNLGLIAKTDDRIIISNKEVLNFFK